ncbi:hypothetical protein MRX96_021620 [Rhipicephalus microplus]
MIFLEIAEYWAENGTENALTAARTSSPVVLAASGQPCYHIGGDSCSGKRDRAQPPSLHKGRATSGLGVFPLGRVGWIYPAPGFRRVAAAQRSAPERHVRVPEACAPLGKELSERRRAALCRHRWWYPGRRSRPSTRVTGFGSANGEGEREEKEHCGGVPQESAADDVVCVITAPRREEEKESTRCLPNTCGRQTFTQFEFGAAEVPCARTTASL